VRTDLPLADQLVQVGHACLEAGRVFEQPGEPCNLVVLRVDSEQALREAATRCSLAGIRFVLFCEPDRGIGQSALCTEPISGSARAVFRRYELWRA